MSEQTPNRLLDHNYDGIQEYDNPMPRWWVWIFWATIIFAEVYFIYYHLGPGKTIHDEYAEEMAAGDAQLAANKPPVLDEAGLQAVFADAARVESGKAVFAGKCAACHAPDGGGMKGLGPNFTDTFWKNGDGTLSAIQKVVLEGVTGTAMQSWESQLKPEELQNVVAYVKSLQGTTPANPKEPEGKDVTLASAEGAAPADTTVTAAP